MSARNIDTSQISFTSPLRAVNALLASSSTPCAVFHLFSKLLTEIRIAVWQVFLPDPESEPGAIFTQRLSSRDHDGYLREPSGQVPIRMTTTCAILLHVNKESRDVVLSWAWSHNYELCYRVSCHPRNYVYARTLPETWLPVQGLIFVRSWDPIKDILRVSDVGFNEPQDLWEDNYTKGERLNNIQHIAFGIHSMWGNLASQWFYQLLAAMPDLKSVSFCFGDRLEDDSEPDAVRMIYAKVVQDPWGKVRSDSDGKIRTPGMSFSAYARWETIDSTPFQIMLIDEDSIKISLRRWYRWNKYWVPVPKVSDAPRYAKDNEAGDLKRLPPWIWDYEKNVFAYHLRSFGIVERRGYDDVHGGLVEHADLLYTRDGLED